MSSETSMVFVIGMRMYVGDPRGFFVFALPLKTTHCSFVAEIFAYPDFSSQLITLETVSVKPIPKSFKKTSYNRSCVWNSMKISSPGSALL